MYSSVFNYQGIFTTESGCKLKGLEIAYTTIGSLNSDRSNIVWAVHALTANAEVADWWNGLVGAGKLYDPKDYFIVCANNIGSCYGSTGPLSINRTTGLPYFHSFPLLTIRDMSNALGLLAEELGIYKINTLIGASLGGQIALEWSIEDPHLFNRLVLIATNAVHSSWGIAFNESQRLAIQADPTWQLSNREAGSKGLIAARSIALLSYRSYTTYRLGQQEDSNEKTNDFKAASYQRYQGEKLVKRFNAFSYFYLSKAMDSHNVIRGRENLRNALNKIRAKTLLININSDLLFPLNEQQLLKFNIPDAELVEISSDYGHDGFLLETIQLKKQIEKWVGASSTATAVLCKNFV